MKEDKVYYTPSIEEFHVGFEYEINYNGKWFLKTIPIYPTTKEKYNEEVIRVKYLDREAIESLGWKCIEQELTTCPRYNVYEFTLAPHKLLTHYGGREYSIIHLEYKNYDNTKEYPILRGCNIKNKSELKTLMEWLRIDPD